VTSPASVAIAIGGSRSSPLVRFRRLRAEKIRAGLRQQSHAPAVPDIPTAQEEGYPELAVDGFQGVFGWRDMPAGLHDRIRLVASPFPGRRHMR